MKKPVCTVILVMINVAVFLVLSLWGMTEDGGFMVEHGAMFVPYVTEYKEYYRILSSWPISPSSQPSLICSFPEGSSSFSLRHFAATFSKL